MANRSANLNIESKVSNIRSRKRAERWQVREQIHELRRETILQEAARCFRRKGYRGTTMGDMARQLRVSKAALYYYVKNKEQILFQCHQVSAEMAMEGLRLAERSGGTVAEKLRIVLRHHIESITDKLKGSVVLLEEGNLTPRLHRQIIRNRDEYEHRLRALVEEGIASGEFVECDPKLVVFAMLGAVVWIAKWYSPEGNRTPREIADVFVAYLVRGLEKAPNGFRIGIPISLAVTA